MYTVKLEAAISINICDLIMQPDAFLTMQKEKVAEQMNVTKTEKKRKRNLSLLPLLKEVENHFGKNFHPWSLY